MNTDCIIDAQRKLIAFLAECEGKTRATEDPHEQLAVCGEVIARLSAEVIEAYGVAFLLAMRNRQIEGEQEAVPGLDSMRPLM